MLSVLEETFSIHLSLFYFYLSFFVNAVCIVCCVLGPIQFQWRSSPLRVSDAP
jgi:hypothetical protein